MNYFRIGSTLPGSVPDINLTVDTSRLQKGRVQGDDNNLFALNEALDRLLRVDGEIAPNALGLIFARRFRDEKIFGLMFDGGFPGGGDSHAQIQRQGCAVFVDAIDEAFQNSPASAKDQIVFSSIHELGHVFNLWHIDDPRSFMTPSEPGVLHEPDTYHFDPNSHIPFLARCSVDSHVRPGGSAWGDRGPGAPAGGGPEDGVRGPFGIEILIDIQPREFWRFDPIELDLEIRSAPGTSRTLDIPRHIEPGYDDFDIWITHPNGERYRYKPVARYCRNFEMIKIAPGKPFKRDIALFGQRGGYTFRTAGVHRIQAVFRLAPHAVLRSNEVEVNVVTEDIRHRAGNELRMALTAPSVAKLMYYKTGDVNASALQNAKEILGSHRSTTAAAGFHYALGRAWLRKIDTQQVGHQSKKPIIRAALQYLNIARDHPKLSAHRRRLAEELVRSYAVQQGRISTKRKVQKNSAKGSRKKKCQREKRMANG